jgi:hypothetical protein
MGLLLFLSLKEDFITRFCVCRAPRNGVPKESPWNSPRMTHPTKPPARASLRGGASDQVSHRASLWAGSATTSPAEQGGVGDRVPHWASLPNEAGDQVPNRASLRERAGYQVLRRVSLRGGAGDQDPHRASLWSETADQIPRRVGLRGGAGNQVPRWTSLSIEPEPQAYVDHSSVLRQELRR